MKKTIAFFVFLAVLAALGTATQLSESQLVDALKKIYDWPAYEKLVFVTADGQFFVFGSGDPDSVTVRFYEIVKTLARKGQDFGTVTNIVHNHKRGLDFSLPDLVLYEKFKKLGFTGKFQIFYPHSGKLKTLEKGGSR